MNWTSPPKKAKRSRNWLIALAVFVLLDVAGLVIFMAVMSSKATVSFAHVEYEKAAIKYRQSGLPWTIEEFIGERIPDDRNAAVAYDSLYEAQKKRMRADHNAGLPPLKRPAFNRLMTQADVSAVNAYLKRLDPELARLPGLADFKFQLKRDWTLGVAVLFPECAVAKGYVRDLLLRAQVKILEGDGKGALEDLRLCCRMAEHVEQGPTLIHLSSGHSYRNLVIVTCLKAATMRSQDPAFLSELAEICGSCSSLPKLKGSFRGEAFLMLQTLRYYDFTPSDLAPVAKGGVRRSPSTDSGPEISGLFNRSYAVDFFKTWARFSRAVGKDDQEDWQAVWEASPPSVESYEIKAVDPKDYERKLLPQMLQADFVAKLLPDFRMALDAFRARQAFALAARTAIRLAASSLSEAERSVQAPLDPFGGGPLKVRTDAGSIKVWSLGKDRDDDKGVAKIPSAPLPPLKRGDPPRPVTPPNGDIVAELPWKPNLAPDSASQGADRP